MLANRSTVRLLLCCAILLLGLAASGCGDRGAVSTQLSGKRVAILVADGYHSREASEPMEYLAARGAHITVIGTTAGTVKALDTSATLLVAALAAQADAAEYDALLIPGGLSPGKLAGDEDVLRLVREAAELGKVIAAIRLGPKLLAQAGVIDGYKLSCAAALDEEIEAARGIRQDQGLTLDRTLITARGTCDIGNFQKAIAQALAGGS